MKPWQADSAIFTTAVIGAVGYPIVQWMLTQMDLLLFHVMRFPLLALLFLPAVIRIRPQWSKLWQAALPGVFLWLGIMSWSYGVMITDQLGSAAFITCLQSLFAPFVARILFATRIHRRTLVGMSVAATGMVMLTLQNGLQITPASQWMILASCLLSVYLVTNAQYSSRFNPIAMSWAQFTACAVLSLAVAPFVSSWNMNPSWELGAALAFMVVIATGLRFLLMIAGQGHTTADRAAIIVMMEPVMVALIAWWWLDDVLNPVQLLGCGLILAAIFIARPRAPKSTAQAGEA